MKRTLILAALALSACYSSADSYHYVGRNLITIDGDTFDAASGGERQRYRLARIDAPEMPGHCRPGRQCAPGDPYASQRALQWLLDQGEPVCRTIDVDVYDRKVVECRNAAAGNLSDAMLDIGQAQPYHFERKRLTATNR